MNYSTFDSIYRKLLLTKFFVKGWGTQDTYKKISLMRYAFTDRTLCKKLIPKNYPVTIDSEKVVGGQRVLDGHFISPVAVFLPKEFPKKCHVAKFEVVLPKKWPSPKFRPVCLHLAGTGDHYFWRRRVGMAWPLCHDYGIGSILLENPFYGYRKPKSQLRSSLHYVTDLFFMGGALILESSVLLHWCERQGFGPLALSGISMGGYMSSLAASNWDKPISLIPCLSWSTASKVFTQGVMSQAIPWKLLFSQYKNDVLLASRVHALINMPSRVKDLLRTDKTVQHDPALSRLLNNDPSISTLEHALLSKLTRSIIVDSLEEVLVEKVNKFIQSSQDAIRNEYRIEENSDEKIITEIANFDGTMSDSKDCSTSFDCSMIEENGNVSRSIEDRIKNHDDCDKEKYSSINKTIIVSRLLGFDKLAGLDGTQHDISELKENHTTSVQHMNDVKLPSNDQSVNNESSIHLNSTEAETCDSPKFTTNKDDFPPTKSLSTWLIQNALESIMNTTGSSLMKNISDSFLATHGKWNTTIDDESNDNYDYEEVNDRLTKVLDQFTHIGNYSCPVDTRLITIISAKYDSYVPKHKMDPLVPDIWPNAEVHMLESGHIMAYLTCQEVFRKAISDSIQRQIDLYY